MQSIFSTQRNHLTLPQAASDLKAVPPLWLCLRRVSPKSVSDSSEAVGLSRNLPTIFLPLWLQVIVRKVSCNRRCSGFWGVLVWWLGGPIAIFLLLCMCAIQSLLCRHPSHVHMGLAYAVYNMVAVLQAAVAFPHVLCMCAM